METLVRSVLRSGYRLRGRPLLQECWLRRCVHVPSDGRARIASAARRPQCLSEACGVSHVLHPLARSTERRHDTLCQAQVLYAGFSGVVRRPESSHQSKMPGIQLLRFVSTTKQVSGEATPCPAYARSGPAGGTPTHVRSLITAYHRNCRKRRPPALTKSQF